MNEATYTDILKVIQTNQGRYKTFPTKFNLFKFYQLEIDPP